MELQLSTDRQISQLRSRYDIEAQPENTLTFAFEDRRYIKLSEQIKTGSETLQLKCLHEVRQDFHKGDSVALALISSGILTVMIDTLTHTNSDIRGLAMEGLKQVASTRLGRQQLMKTGRAAKMVDLIDDTCSTIRMHCYCALIEFVDFLENAQHLLDDECEVVERLVDKMMEEKEENIQMLNLKLVDRLMTCPSGVQQLLKTAAIKRLLSLASRQNTGHELTSLALECLASLSFNVQAKNMIQQQDGVTQLAQRLYDHSSLILTSATKALASLAQLIPAKKVLIHTNHFQQTLQLLNHQDTQIQLNVIQLLTSLAEDPKGRQMCINSCLDQLKQRLHNKEHSFLNQYLQQAIEVITWVP